jgi:putative transposase
MSPKNKSFAIARRLSVILKLVYPLASRIRERWVRSRGRLYRVSLKLDPVKVAWIVRQKEKGQLPNRMIARSMGVSPIWVKKLWRRYRAEGKVPELGRPGRKRSPGLSQQDKETVVEARKEYKASAVILERVIDSTFGVHIPHNRIHRVLKEMGLAREEPKKQMKRKWVRYERKYSNSLWHTDWTLIEGKGWMTAYLDDASRLVVGYGVTRAR